MLANLPFNILFPIRFPCMQISIRGTVPDDDMSLVDPQALSDHAVHMVINMTRIRQEEGLVRWNKAPYCPSDG